MEDARFQQLLAKYPQSIGYGEIPKIAWGLLDDNQFDTLLAKVAGTAKERARGLRDQGWNPDIFTPEDYPKFDSNIFDILGRNYQRNDPEYYFKYFYVEAKAVPDRPAIAAVFNQLFDKLPAAPHMRLKAPLDYVKTVVPNGATTYTFTGGANAAGTWREALTALMVQGFHAQPRAVGGALDPSIASALLENRFVENIAAPMDGFLGNPEIKVFWRCDGRDKANFLDRHAAEAAVDLVDRAADLNLSQPWNPYSADKVKNAMWLRKASLDNDYYTIVSVAIDFKTSVPFPTLDEQKNPDYQFPMLDDKAVKPLNQWSPAELTTHRKNLARIQVATNRGVEEKIRICTKTHAYMAVVHNGFMINTQAYGGGQFPERAVRGLPVDSVAAYLPFLRVHHGGSRESGFTMFPAGTDSPVMLIDEDQLRARYGLLGAEAVNKLFFDAKTMILGRGKLAWAASGSAAPDTILNVTRVLERPLKAAVQPNDPRLT